MLNPNLSQFGGSPPPPPPPQQQKGCLGRNWKWMLPVGCLGLIVAGVLLVGGIIFAAMSAIKSSEVYQGALKVAQTHPAVTERLGQPVKDGWLVKGNIKLDAGGGSANFEIPLSGPKNAGTLFVAAVSPEGTWMYEKLDLVTGGETVSLLDRNVVQPPPGSEVDVEGDADGSDDSSEEAGGDTPDTADDETADGDEAQTDAATVSVGALDGKAISKPRPPYPALAKAAQASGLVTVRVTVDATTGSVVSANAVSGHPLLRAAAVAAAKQAKFSPTIVDGKPVRVTGTLSYDFVLEQ